MSDLFDKPKRGIRLPEDWVLPDNWRRWAREARPDINPDEQAEIFRDYWIAVPGQKGVKVNWEATWRNWIRRQKVEPGRAASHAEYKPKTKPRITKEKGLCGVQSLRLALKGQSS